MQQQLQLQQIQIQSPQPNQQQYLNQQEQQQQIQNQLIQQQQSGQLTNATITQPNISQINIQPKPQMIIGPQQTSFATSQAQSMDNRPTIMSMVSISGGSLSSAGTPLIQPIAGLASPPHVTLQPPQNPLAAMTTLSYNASPSNPNLSKDDKQKSDQQKLNDQLQQSAIHTLVSLSTATSVVSTAPTLTSTTATLANGDQSSDTNTVATSSTDAAAPVDTTSASGKHSYSSLE